MSNGDRVTWQEAAIWSGLVATHWTLTRRNPTDAESDEMVAVARQLASEHHAAVQ
ncbi:hypothetical protein [Tardiphaga sp. 285_C5_N1_2]|uniref:hypothetical protein n=1 Tax=Tardiphaga sp. 285_C5_N1_2 TaxID=3240775 RepID=UPI003F8C8137